MNDGVSLDSIKKCVCVFDCSVYGDQIDQLLVHQKVELAEGE